jgi:predicted PolB exonuclease-like 3'-5' exonuclease
MYLFMDLETANCDELEWQPPEGDPKKFPPLPYHKVVVLGTMLADIDLHRGACEVAWFGSLREDEDVCLENEQWMLEQYANIMRKDRPTLVTYNGRGFDVPLLSLRGMRYGVPMAFHFGKDFRYRYSETGHQDVADDMCDYGAAYRYKLGDAAQLLGLPGKLGIDGTKVWGYYKEGRTKEIEEYCWLDVFETACLFMRLQLTKGRMSIEAYQSIVQSLLDAADRKASPSGYLWDALNQIERSVLLIGEPELPF